ncbi:hypothetical protein HBI70_206570 [Parastagonospora nodorum]|nr:hypothetical protein HBH50_053260 [Parastagonospora nodorum]KAH4179572.1 hypothetical protein HBH43_019090 [Parastagonospora nodorum]KAH4468484.1 hypothetical protein HBH91_013320 [Parastagonospora nodorum]KAH4516346.1 hypothetical protein HBH89_014680 [Parastagonospora nodorum]KAH4554504.1 hypothetical protein HBH85_006710 [Parastagonospora nodorum]
MAAGEQATARLSNFGRRWWLWASCSRVSRGSALHGDALLIPLHGMLLCVLTPSSTSAPNYRDITLHAIKSTPGMAHSLHTALQPHLVSASLHHLSKLAVIAQQCHSLKKTVMMIQPYKAAQGYLAIHSVHQTPEP